MIRRSDAFKELATLAMLVAVSGTPAFARDHPAKVLGKSCIETTVKINIYSGQIIRTNNGYVFQVGPFEQFDTQFWQPDDDLSICATRVREGGKVVTHYVIKDYYSHGDTPGGEHVTLISGPNTK